MSINNPLLLFLDKILIQTFVYFVMLLEQVVLGISSFLIEPMCQWMGSRLVWALSNFAVFACMAGTAIITLISVQESTVQNVVGKNETIKNASLVIFAILGLPLAVNTPYSLDYFVLPISLCFMQILYSVHDELLICITFTDHLQCSLLCHSRIDC